MTKQDVLEQAIASALESTKSSTEIDALISRVESAVPEAEQDAQVAEARANDLTLEPDPVAAAASAQAKRQGHIRLVNVLPKLRARYAEVAAEEYAARWGSQYREVKAECDAIRSRLCHSGDHHSRAG